MARLRGGDFIVLGLVVAALWACKKKDEQPLPDVEVPEAAAAPVATEPAPAPAADAAAPTPTVVQPVPRRDAGAPADAGTRDAGPQDAGAGARDASAAAPPADAGGGGSPNWQACVNTCQAQWTACLGNLQDAGMRATCANQLRDCSRACGQR